MAEEAATIVEMPADTEMRLRGAGDFSGLYDHYDALLQHLLESGHGEVDVLYEIAQRLTTVSKHLPAEDPRSYHSWLVRHRAVHNVA